MRAALPLLFVSLAAACEPAAERAAAAPPTSAQRAESSAPSRIDALVRAEVQAQDLIGLTVAVGTTRGFAWSRGYGIADVENGVPATADTVYRFASVSKTITAVAALQLVEAGTLDLDAPIQRYVASFPEKRWPVTARHILDHSSGIRHYAEDETETLVHYPTLEAGLARFKDDPLRFAPGSAYEYSSYAYNLLGRAVEGASGESYVAYVRGHVLEPAGMTSTRDDDLFAIIPHRAQGYTRADGGALANAELADTSYKIPSGGLCGTARDLVAFALGIASHRLLRAETVERMLTVTLIGAPPRPNPDGFGLGWMIDTTGGERAAFHTGAQPRVASIVYFLPDRGVAVAVLSNLEGAKLRTLARAMAQATLLAKE